MRGVSCFSWAKPSDPESLTTNWSVKKSGLVRELLQYLPSQKGIRPSIDDMQVMDKPTKGCLSGWGLTMTALGVVAFVGVVSYFASASQAGPNA